MLATLARLRRRYALPDPEALERIAQERRERPTRAERALAAFLNEVNGHALEGRFVREWVCGGRWIVDFYFPEVRLAIEVDGGYHRSTFQLGWDLFKAAELEAAGVTVVRLTNQEALGDRARLRTKLRDAWRAARRSGRRAVGSGVVGPAGREAGGVFRQGFGHRRDVRIEQPAELLGEGAEVVDLAR